MSWSFVSHAPPCVTLSYAPGVKSAASILFYDCITRLSALWTLSFLSRPRVYILIDLSIAVIMPRQYTAWSEWKWSEPHQNFYRARQLGDHPAEGYEYEWEEGARGVEPTQEARDRARCTAFFGFAHCMANCTQHFLSLSRSIPSS